MPYNFVADSIHTKKLCSRLSSSKRFYTEKAVLRFFEPPWEAGDGGGVGQRTMIILGSLEST